MTEQNHWKLERGHQSKDDTAPIPCKIKKFWEKLWIFSHQQRQIGQNEKPEHRPERYKEKLLQQQGHSEERGKKE